jgi:lipid-A-disaccharide synthase
MVNLIAEDRIVPELVQQDFTPERVAAEMKKIIPDGQPREDMLRGLQIVKNRLQGTTGGTSAPARAAGVIRSLLDKSQTQPRA